MILAWLNVYGATLFAFATITGAPNHDSGFSAIGWAFTTLLTINAYSAFKRA